MFFGANKFFGGLGVLAVKMFYLLGLLNFARGVLTMVENRGLTVTRSRFTIILTALFLAAPSLWAKGELASSPTNYEMVEAPTAYTLMHGGYDLITRVYENGGLFLRANIGFKEFFMFGFSANATNVIGQGEIQVQTPRLFLKIKPLDQKASPVALAVAWDDRGYGTEIAGRFSPGLQKGFYAVVSHEFQEFGFVQVHGGVNAVKFDHFDSGTDLGAFAGTSFAVAPPLMFNFEFDKIINSFWQFNANIVYNVDNPLRVGFDFRDINNGGRFSRILRVQYQGFF
jgi:hypothetical protein